MFNHLESWKWSITCNLFQFLLYTKNTIAFLIENYPWLCAYIFYSFLLQRPKKTNPDSFQNVKLFLNSVTIHKQRIFPDFWHAPSACLQFFSTMHWQFWTIFQGGPIPIQGLGLHHYFVLVPGNSPTHIWF